MARSAVDRLTPRHAVARGCAVDDTARTGVCRRLHSALDHVWFWRARLLHRKGERCRVLARGRMNSVLVEFADGEKVITSRYAVRMAR